MSAKNNKQNSKNQKAFHTKEKTSTLTLHNLQKINLPKAVLKLDKEKLEQTLSFAKKFGITNFAANQLKSSLSKNFSSVLNQADFFVNYTKNLWGEFKKSTNLDASLPKNMITKNYQISQAYAIITLNKLRNSIDEYGKTEAKQPFVFSNAFYKNMLKVQKVIVAEDVYKVQYAFGTKMFIRHLLLGNYKEKTYLFARDIMINENDPKMHVALNLLVNGSAKGLKPIARYDTNGQFQNSVLFNVGLVSDDLPLEYRVGHINHLHKGHGDPFFKRGTVSSYEHMHLSTRNQDLFYAAQHYFLNNLNLPIKLTSAKLSAIETDLFASDTKLNKQLPVTEQDLQNVAPEEFFKRAYEAKEHIIYRLGHKEYTPNSLARRVKLATETNGIIPFQYVYNYTKSYFNVDNDRFTSKFYKDIDKIRDNKLSDHVFPSLQQIYQKNYFNKMQKFSYDPATAMKHRVEKPVVLEGMDLTRILTQKGFTKDN